MVCTARYVVPWTSGETISSLQTAVEHALVAVVMRHGILRVGIAGEDEPEPVFTYLKTIDLREMIEWKQLPGSGSDGDGDGEYVRALLRSTEERHDRLWEDLPRRPGWKLIVHHARQDGGRDAPGRVNLDISLAFHHAYADGQSVYIFHRDLLRALNSTRDEGGGVAPPAELQDHVLHLTKPPTIPPPFETLVPFTTSWGFLLRLVWWEVVWKNLAPAWARREPRPETLPWTGGPVDPEPHRARLRLVRATPDAVDALLTACRARRTTLTPLLHALALASLAARLPAHEAPAFVLNTAINMRRFAKAASDLQQPFDPDNDLHCLVTSHPYLADAAIVSALRSAAATKKAREEDADREEVLWKPAAGIGEDLRAKMATLPRNDIVGLAGMVSDWRARWAGQFGKRKERTWECSNAGSMRASDANLRRGDDDDDGGKQGWRIERVLFSQGATPVGGTFALNVAGVEGRGICIVVNWQDTNVDDAVMEGLVADLQRWIDAFGATGRFGAFDG